MLIVGLTGGIATGKSTVSAHLKDQGIPVIDLDELAREVVQPGERTHAKIVKHFGEDILLPDRTLNRPKLGSIVFNNDAERKVLNSLTHPAIRRRMVARLVRNWLLGASVTVVDSPLLIESGMWRYMGLVLLAYCPPDIQIARLMARNGFTEEEASSRIQSQLSIEKKKPYADVVLDNSGTKEELLASLDVVISACVRPASFWSRLTYYLNWIPPVGLFWGLLKVALRNTLYTKKIAKAE